MHLRRAERLQPLDQLVKDEDFPETQRLLGCEALKSGLSEVAESKGAEDLNVWQYSEKKALSYLSAKVERVCAHLKESGVDIRGGAVSSNYVRSLKEEIDDGKGPFRLPYKTI